MPNSKPSILLALLAIASCAAMPEVPRSQMAERAKTAQTVHLSFQSGTEYYNMMIPANGMKYYTGRVLRVLIVYTKPSTLCGMPM